MANKSLYLFLTVLLGALLFLIVDRVFVFLYLFAFAGGFVSAEFLHPGFLYFDYYSLTVVIMLGAWYGIWLGLYWYKKVYEEQSHWGFIHHVATNYFPARPAGKYRPQMEDVKRRLENDLWELEELAQPAPALIEIKSKAVKRKVVRRQAPKKFKSTVSV